MHGSGNLLHTPIGNRNPDRAIAGTKGDLLSTLCDSFLRASAYFIRAGEIRHLFELDAV